MTVTVTGTTITGCTIGPYYSPDTFLFLFIDTAPIVSGNLPIVTLDTPLLDTAPIVSGNLPIVTLDTPLLDTAPIVSGNLSVVTLNAPNIDTPVFIGV